MTFSQVIAVLVAVSAVVTAQSVSGECKDVCTGNSGYCSASESDYGSCSINCKGGCDCTDYAGYSCVCTTNCVSSTLAAWIIVVIVIASICTCCVLPCFLFYKCGQGSRTPAQYTVIHPAAPLSIQADPIPMQQQQAPPPNYNQVRSPE
jgi:hypothetical protein